MRITNKTMVDTFLNNLNKNLTNMKTSQDQLSSGKNISKPSDDPYGTARSMELNNSVDRNSQYLSTIEDSSGLLNTTDTALGQVTDSLQRIRVLMISSASGSKSLQDINANKQEIIQRIEEIGQTGNAQFDGKYIFSGNDTGTQPFKSDGGGNITMTVNDNGKLKREISPNVVIDINITASQLVNCKHKKAGGTDESIKLINSPGDINPSTLDEIKNALDAGDTAALGGDLLQKITEHIDNILRCRGEVGAKENRMDSAKSKNEEETANITSILAKVEDVDVTQKIIEYKTMETVYQASLMAGAKVLQPSLVDFLK